MLDFFESPKNILFFQGIFPDYLASPFSFLESEVKSIEGGAKQLLGKQSDNNQVGAVSDWRQHENSPSNSSP